MSFTVRRLLASLFAGAIVATLSAACGAADDRGQNSVDQAQFSLVGLDGHEATQAVYERVGERYGLDCEQSWEASLDVTGLDPNYPEASGLADGSEPTPEILDAIREAGSHPDSFEHWYVTSTRAVFASFEIEEGWNALPEVIQVLWLGYDAEGTPRWGADYGALLGPC